MSLSSHLRDASRQEFPQFLNVASSVSIPLYQSFLFEPKRFVEVFIPSMGNFVHFGALKKLKSVPIVLIFLHEPNAGAA